MWNRAGDWPVDCSIFDSPFWEVNEMHEQHEPAADRHCVPNWQPLHVESDDMDRRVEQDLNRKTDPDATDEYPCLSGSNRE